MNAQINWLNTSPAWGMEAAEHNTTSSATLSKLAAHNDLGVRTAVAENPNTLLSTVMRLAQDQCVDLRYAIAENHQMDGHVLRLLLADDNPYVAHRAERTLARCANEANIVSLPVVPGISDRLKLVG
jgi:hypothetical protein